jgi:hypothetical protein
MTVGLILVTLAVVAVVAIVVINRVSGPRPDRPMAGKDDDADAPAHDTAAGQDSTWTADRPGDPGQESMNPEQSGDPSPGPSDGDGRAHRAP